MLKSDKHKYLAAGFVGAGIGSLFAGCLGIVGGLYVGIQVGRDEMEKKIYIYDHAADGKEGLCIQKNDHQIICAYDTNSDGAVDIVLYEDGVPKEVKWGKEKCLLPVKSLEQLTNEESEQKKE